MFREAGSSLEKIKVFCLQTFVPELGYDSVGDLAPPWRARQGRICVKSSPGEEVGTGGSLKLTAQPSNLLTGLANR